MKIRNFKWVVVVGLATIAIAGCAGILGLGEVPSESDDGGGNDANPAETSPGEGGPGDETGGGDSGGVDSGGVDSGGVDADCSQNPTLRDWTSSFFCPFIPDASPCTNPQTCCDTFDKVGSTFQPAYCTTGTKGDGTATCKAGAAAHGSSFDAGDAWECADKNACSAGQLCCMIVDPFQAAMGKALSVGSTLPSDTKHPLACGVHRAFNEGGSRCRTGTACPTGEIKLCSLSDMNCAAPTTCTPFVDFRQTNRGTCL